MGSNVSNQRSLPGQQVATTLRYQTQASSQILERPVWQVGRQNQQSRLLQRQMQAQQQQGQSQYGRQASQIPQGQNLPIMNPQRLSVFNNQASIRISSTQLTPDKKDKNKSHVSFIFDSHVGIIIQTYAFVTEKSDPINNLTSECYNHLQMDKQQFEKPEKNLDYQTQFSIDFTKLSALQIKSTKEGFWPLIIRLETIVQAPEEKKIQFYYYEIDNVGQKPKLKFKRQKLEFNFSAFEVQEIYGIAGSGLVQEEESKQIDEPKAALVSDQDKECIICFSEKIDTVIMPCRHMCICIQCASLFQEKQRESAQRRQNTNNCPVCRKEIESFIRIKSQVP